MRAHTHTHTHTPTHTHTHTHTHTLSICLSLSLTHTHTHTDTHTHTHKHTLHTHIHSHTHTHTHHTHTHTSHTHTNTHHTCIHTHTNTHHTYTHTHTHTHTLTHTSHTHITHTLSLSLTFRNIFGLSTSNVITGDGEQEAGVKMTHKGGTLENNGRVRQQTAHLRHGQLPKSTLRLCRKPGGVLSFNAAAHVQAIGADALVLSSVDAGAVVAARGGSLCFTQSPEGRILEPSPLEKVNVATTTIRTLETRRHAVLLHTSLATEEAVLI